MIDNIYCENNFGSFGAAVALIVSALIYMTFIRIKSSSAMIFLCFLGGEMLLISELAVCKETPYMFHVFFLSVWYIFVIYTCVKYKCSSEDYHIEDEEVVLDPIEN